MPDLAIRVDNRSKPYPSALLGSGRACRIGRKEETRDTLAGAVTGCVRRPIHDVRSLPDPDLGGTIPLVGAASGVAE